MKEVKHYKALAISTRYWKPNDDYIAFIIEAVKGKLRNGDIVTVSEKAISTSSSSIIDESKAKSSRTAVFMAKYWMPISWGYILGPFCHLRKETIQRFKNYPTKEGAQHKQVALQYAGFLQALMHGSEGGIDGSNLPYAYVSLTLQNAPKNAQKIQKTIQKTLGRKVTVLIVDTDKTYSLGSFHFTPRPEPIKGIHSNYGVFAYVIGRFLKLRNRATPIAIAGKSLSTEEALNIAMIAHKARGSGAGSTVWDMAEKFDVALTKVSWNMLAEIEHKPVVIVRAVKGKIFA